MTKRTVFLIFLLVALVAILSFIAVLQSVEQTRRAQETSNQTAVTPTIDPSLVPDTTLTASPAAALVKMGAAQTIDILIDTGNNNLLTTQLGVGFDPEFFEVQNVTPGPFFQNPTVLLNNVDVKTGRISYALGTLTPQKGQGVLTTITMLAKKPTGSTGKTSDLTLLPKTQVLGSSNQNLNSLVRTMAGSQFVITNSNE